MAAVLSGEKSALLSHQSMAEHFDFRPRLGQSIEITIPGRCRRSREGLIIHRSDIDPSHHAPMRGVAPLREALDRRTFAMSRSELERRFRPICARVGLPKPETCVMRNGWEVDFLWRDLRLVVETDSLRYHRTAAQQHRDRVRDQAHLAAGDTPVRFSHSQVRYEAVYVEHTLGKIVREVRARQQTVD